MDTGRVDPRVGSGWVRILGKFGGSGRVEISEMKYVKFEVCTFCRVDRNCNEKSYISTLAKLL